MPVEWDRVGGKTGEFRRRFDTEKEEERGKSKRRDGGRESERVEVGDGKGGRRGGGTVFQNRVLISGKPHADHRIPRYSDDPFSPRPNDAAISPCLKTFVVPPTSGSLSLQEGGILMALHGACAC